MIYQNLDLPATLIHSINGKKYTLNGKLLAVNESSKLATMDFDGKISKNVPLDEVYLNEGALKDYVSKTGKKLKDAAKKVWSKIVGVVKSIGGLLVPIDEDGTELTQYANVPFNWPLANLPKTFKVIPSEKTIAFCEANGGKVVNNNTVDEAFQAAMEQDILEIETYWSRIMKEYAKPENESLTLSETVKMVNETYYHKTFNTLVLNETVASLHSGSESLYGKELNTKGLVSALVNNIKQQLMPVTPGQKGRSMLIWGAPGIGKTAILNQAAKLMNKYFKKVLDMSVISCTGLTFDAFDLPDTERNYAHMKLATSSPADWLPVYDVKGLSKDRIKEIDDMYNNGTYRIRERKKSDITGNPEDADVNASLEDMEITEFFDGGILFFDEIARIEDGRTMNIMMSLFNERRFKNLVMASKWALVAAANRLTDNKMTEYDTNFNAIWDDAKNNRFEHCTFVPTKAEWLEWARDVNTITGRQNVDEIICEFIERSPDYVWYDALDFGSREIEGTDTVKQGIQLVLDKLHDGSELTTDEFKTLGRYVSNPSAALHNMSKVTWNGRTWQQYIWEPVLNVLDTLLGQDKDKFEACFKVDQRERKSASRTETYQVKNLDRKSLEAQLNSIDQDYWDMITEGICDDCDPTGRLRKYDRLGFFYAIIGSKIAAATGGKEAKVFQQWDYYNKIEAIMKPADVRSIYKNGTPADKNMAKEDNYIFPKNDLYGHYQNVRWKSTSDMIDSICSIVFDAFDTYITGDQALTDFEQINRSLKKIEDGKLNFKPSKADIDLMIEKYTLHLVDPQTKKTVDVPTLLSPDVACQEGMAEKYVFILNNSKLAEYMANLAMWVSKISIETGPTTPIDALLGQSDVTGVKGTIMNRWSQIIRKNQECLALYNVPGSKLPDYDLAKPAINILSIMQQYDREKIFRKLQ